MSFLSAPVLLSVATFLKIKWFPVTSELKLSDEMPDDVKCLWLCDGFYQKNGGNNCMRKSEQFAKIIWFFL